MEIRAGLTPYSYREHTGIPLVILPTSLLGRRAQLSPTAPCRTQGAVPFQALERAHRNHQNSGWGWRGLQGEYGAGLRIYEVALTYSGFRVEGFGFRV